MSEQNRDVVKGLFEYNQDSRWFTELQEQFKTEDNPVEGLATGAAALTELDSPPETTYYYLNVTFDGDGSGRIFSSPAGLNSTGNCSAAFVSNMSTNIMAYPDEGSEFDTWLVEGVPSGAVTFLSINALDGTHEITARFVLL